MVYIPAGYIRVGKKNPLRIAPFLHCAFGRSRIILLNIIIFKTWRLLIAREFFARADDLVYIIQLRSSNRTRMCKSKLPFLLYFYHNSSIKIQRLVAFHYDNASRVYNRKPYRLDEWKLTVRLCDKKNMFYGMLHVFIIKLLRIVIDFHCYCYYYNIDMVTSCCLVQINGSYIITIINDALR